MASLIDLCSCNFWQFAYYPRMSSFRTVLKFAFVTMIALATSVVSAVDLAALCGDRHFPHAQHEHGDDADGGCAHGQADIGDLGHRDSADDCGCILADLATAEEASLTRPVPLRGLSVSSLRHGLPSSPRDCFLTLRWPAETPIVAAQRLAWLSAHRTVVLRV